MVTLSSRSDGKYVIDTVAKNGSKEYVLKRLPKPMIGEYGSSFSCMLSGSITKFELVDRNSSFDLLAGNSPCFFLSLRFAYSLMQKVTNKSLKGRNYQKKVETHACHPKSL